MQGFWLSIRWHIVITNKQVLCIQYGVAKNQFHGIRMDILHLITLQSYITLFWKVPNTADCYTLMITHFPIKLWLVSTLKEHLTLDSSLSNFCDRVWAMISNFSTFCTGNVVSGRYTEHWHIPWSSKEPDTLANSCNYKYI